MDKNLRPFVAELIGTFALVFLGAGTICTSYLAVGPVEFMGQAQPHLVGIALAIRRAPSSDVRTAAE